MLFKYAIQMPPRRQLLTVFFKNRFFYNDSIWRNFDVTNPQKVKPQRKKSRLSLVIFASTLAIILCIFMYLPLTLSPATKWLVARYSPFTLEISKIDWKPVKGRLTLAGIHLKHQKHKVFDVNDATIDVNLSTLLDMQLKIDEITFGTSSLILDKVEEDWFIGPIKLGHQKKIEKKVEEKFTLPRIILDRLSIEKFSLSQRNRKPFLSIDEAKLSSYDGIYKRSKLQILISGNICSEKFLVNSSLETSSRFDLKTDLDIKNLTDSARCLADLGMQAKAPLGGRFKGQFKVKLKDLFADNLEGQAKLDIKDAHGHLFYKNQRFVWDAAALGLWLDFAQKDGFSLNNINTYAKNMQLSLAGNQLKASQFKIKLLSAAILPNNQTKMQSILAEAQNIVIEDEMLAASILESSLKAEHFNLNKDSGWDSLLGELDLVKISVLDKQSENKAPEHSLNITRLKTVSSRQSTTIAIKSAVVTRATPLGGEKPIIFSNANLNIETSEKASSPILFKSQIGTYGSIEFSQKINDKKTRTKAAFKAVELAPFSSLTSPIIGYAVNEGIASGNLEWNTASNGNINGHLDLLLRKWQIEPTPKQGQKDLYLSVLGVSLPTAFNLAKDENEDIRLSFPIEGNKNSPQFRIIPLLTSKGTNLITSHLSAALSESLVTAAAPALVASLPLNPAFLLYLGRKGWRLAENQLLQDISFTAKNTLSNKGRINLKNTAKILKSSPSASLKVCTKVLASSSSSEAKKTSLSQANKRLFSVQKELVERHKVDPENIILCELSKPKFSKANVPPVTMQF